MSIERKYNELRTAYLSLQDVADGHHTRESVERWAEICTEIAANAWPEDRARMAEARVAIPEGPTTYRAGNGYTQVHLSGCIPGLCSARPLSDLDTRVHAAAEAVLRAEYAIKADAAKAAFDRYAIAVAQGVAVAPEGAK